MYTREKIIFVNINFTFSIDFGLLFGCTEKNEYLKINFTITITEEQ